jgi:hypothetical protein
MRTILIDPVAMTVSEYDLQPGLPAIYEAIGVDGKRAGFDTVHLAPDVMGFVDDFGMFREGQRFFYLDGSRQMLGGRMLMAGLDETNGETVALPDRVTRDLVQSRAIWLGSAENVEVSINLGMIDRPETAVSSMGKDGKMVREVVWRWTPAECSGQAQGEARGNQTSDAMARAMGLGEKQ